MERTVRFVPIVDSLSQKLTGEVVASHTEPLRQGVLLHAQASVKHSFSGHGGFHIRQRDRYGYEVLVPNYEPLLYSYFEVAIKVSVSSFGASISSRSNALNGSMREWENGALKLIEPESFGAGVIEFYAAEKGNTFKGFPMNEEKLAKLREFRKKNPGDYLTDDKRDKHRSLFLKRQLLRLSKYRTRCSFPKFLTISFRGEIFEEGGSP